MSESVKIARVNVGKTIKIPSRQRWGYRIVAEGVEFYIPSNGEYVPNKQRTNYSECWRVYQFGRKIMLYEVIERDDARPLESYFD